jgi:hypothetical protein
MDLNPVNASLLKVHCTNLEGFFWGTEECSIEKERRLVALVAIGKKGHAPVFFFTKVSQSTEMQGIAYHAIAILFGGFIDCVHTVRAHNQLKIKRRCLRLTRFVFPD